MKLSRTPADVCLILEGTYPFVTGGVSTWTHDLIKAQKHLAFHLVNLSPYGTKLKIQYEIPPNVTGMTHIYVQDLPSGGRSLYGFGPVFRQLEAPLTRMFAGGGLSDLALIVRLLAPFRARLGSRILLNSVPAWEMLLNMYRRRFNDTAFLDYFWTWRALLGGLYSVLLPDLPPARVYHAVSTGYAGIFAARAYLETGRPVLLTEHGIYTNERRIEISLAEWLYEVPYDRLSIATDETRRSLRDMWVDTFVCYSRACYQACARIITLYEGNQQFQVEDGAPADRLLVIPNGIDYARYSSIPRESGQRPLSIALVGRVVPIKDVKTFIRACAVLREVIPDFKAWVMGPTEEDEKYFEECKLLVRHLSLEESVAFTGRVKLDEHLAKIDVLVMTSISEAQPLVILEAGASGIPAVATDVGACREMILGRSGETPSLGAGGVVTELANPTATAEALIKLHTNREFYRQCSRAIRERVRRYYDIALVNSSYQELYDRYRSQQSNPPAGERGAWQESALNCAS
jgi:glycosyltransferase involved in cell wall biosynthesis